MKTNLEAYNKIRREHDRSAPCHAPSRNLFFTNTGVVLSCCFNRAYEVGRYPENSVDEIWNGLPLKKLKEKLVAADFSLGCSGCKMMIESGNYDSLPARTYDNYITTNPSLPVSFEFELSNICNLECIMCSGEFSSSIRENREKKAVKKSPYNAEFLKQIETYFPTLQRAQFLGGEPFLIPIYLEIWERMIEINPHISISVQTNGTTLNNRVKKILDRLSFSIAVSIDGASKETYEAIRINSSFERVIENLEYFSTYCTERRKNLSLSFCPMPQNIHEVGDMVKLANRLNARIFFNTVFDPPQCSLMNLDKSRLKSISEEITGLLLPADTDLQKQNNEALVQLALQILAWSKSEEKFSTASLNSKHDSAEALFEEIKKGLGPDNEETYQQIKERLDYILQRAQEENIHEVAYQKMLTLNAKSIIDSVAIIEKERLYHMFKDRVLRL